MAEALKRQYGLLALKITFDTYGEAPLVRLALQTKAGADMETLREWKYGPADFGLPRKIGRDEARGPGVDFRLPEALKRDLRQLLAQPELNSRPVWLHLVRPYGYVGLIPWERLLIPEVHVPILRLPDFIVPPPRESHRALDVLLCASAPMAKELFPAVAELGRMAKRIVEAVPRSVRLHFFIDGSLSQPLQQELKPLGLVGDQARIYDAHDAEPYTIPDATSRIVDVAGRIQSPWLLWMRDSLRGKSVDVVHLLCHGYFANDRGAVAFSQSPTVNADPRMSRFVGPTELGIFLTQVGAWGSVLSSPRNNYSDIGTRALAEELGQTLPGSVLFHDVARDPQAQALGQAYRLLFCSEPQVPPVSPALFMYCQPRRIAGSGFEAAALLDDLGSIVAEHENVPAWLAASSRYIEKCDVEVRRTARARGADANASAVNADEETLQKIQSVLARVARAQKPS